jgi:hypothetical protein
MVLRKLEGQIAMSGLIVLERVELIPVLELEPAVFSTQSPPSPSCSGSEAPEAWDRYWKDCLADSNLTGLEAIWPGSWLVPTTQLRNLSTLGDVLRAILNHWGRFGRSVRPRGGPRLAGRAGLPQP